MLTKSLTFNAHDTYNNICQKNNHICFPLLALVPAKFYVLNLYIQSFKSRINARIIKTFIQTDFLYLEF